MRSQKYNLKLKSILALSVLLLSTLLFRFKTAKQVWAGPTSTNYELIEFGFGAGGTNNSLSPNYQVLGIVGEIDSGQSSSTNYQVGNGLVYTLTANVPPAPTFTNPSNYYNKLKLVINEGGNTSDAKYAIAISIDNFATDTRYVQSDNTVGTTLGLED